MADYTLRSDESCAASQSITTKSSPIQDSKLEDLSTHHKLPQELIDPIYNMVFSVAPKVCDVDELFGDVSLPDLISPNLLAVTQHSRAQIIRSCFENTVFVSSRLAAKVWLDKVSPTHRSMIRDLRIKCYAAPSVANNTSDAASITATFGGWYGAQFAANVRHVYDYNGVWDFYRG